MTKIQRPGATLRATGRPCGGAPWGRSASGRGAQAAPVVRLRTFAQTGATVRRRRHMVAARPSWHSACHQVATESWDSLIEYWGMCTNSRGYVCQCACVQVYISHRDTGTKIEATFEARRAKINHQALCCAAQDPWLAIRVDLPSRGKRYQPEDQFSSNLMSNDLVWNSFGNHGGCMERMSRNQNMFLRLTRVTKDKTTLLLGCVRFCAKTLCVSTSIEHTSCCV